MIMSIFSGMIAFNCVLFAIIFLNLNLWQRMPFLSGSESLNHDEWISAISNYSFPKGFLFGVTTSAYQTEGTWNLTGESVWDHIIYSNPNLIKDKSNAGIAADSYHKYKEDIQLAKGLRSKIFKISLSWTRIMPDGFGNRISDDGIRYYNDVINEMLANDIEPMITLLHGDMPNRLQKWGGLLNPLFVDWFTEYARVVFKAFAGRVKYWITINEPGALCKTLYGGEIAMMVNESGLADYYCGHHALLAHAKVYHMYHRDFRKVGQGKIGIAQQYWNFEPVNMESKEDILATENSKLWYNGWLTNPIFGPFGDYPSTMKHEIGIKSNLQGYPTSRLPAFTQEEINQIKGSADFLGINYYGLVMVEGKTAFNDQSHIVSFDDDINSKRSEKIWDLLSTWAFGTLLQDLNNDYNLPEIYITESGYFDEDILRDLSRAVFFHAYLNQLISAMYNGVNIRGYLIRNLIDGFEWLNGYSLASGLYHVDFKSPNRTRTPRLSSYLVAEIFKDRNVDNTLNFLSDYLAKHSF